MLDLAMAEFSRHEDKLQTLEEKINPAANKSTQVCYLILRALKVTRSDHRGYGCVVRHNGSYLCYHKFSIDIYCLMPAKNNIIIHTISVSRTDGPSTDP